MSSLIIVESFSKSNTISKYLNSTFTVTYSSGHICDLPQKELGIDTNTWIPTYKPTNIRVIKNIRDLVKGANAIYIASDPDIEGEAIAYHIKNSITDLLNSKICYRISFNEITKNVILNAIEKPTNINLDIVEAQETRRIVDRLIGYKISPLLWNQFGDKFLSAGRVQIASLIICINQKNIIQKKELIPLWSIIGIFNLSNINLNGNLMSNNNIWKSKNEKEVLNKLDTLKINDSYHITYERHLNKTSPSAPYTTTSLQQDSYNKLRFSSKHTMKLSQDLYERGFITYIRTDSTNINETAKIKIIEYIKKTYGYDKAEYRVYKTKIVNAQEAHEAIRITEPSITDITEDGDIKTDHLKLYNLIWKRTIACLMVDADYIECEINIKKDVNEFKSRKSFLINEGFKIIYGNTNEKQEYSKFIKLLDKKNCISKLFTSNASIDNIPSMYNEVQLIKELEKEGIGRPSTYATTIDKLMSKNYVMKGSNPQQNISVSSYEKKNNSNVIIKNNVINLGGKQKDLLIPTELGLNIIEYIYTVAPYLCDLKFTAKLEKDMNYIINKKMRKVDILNSLYSKIQETINNTSNKKNDSRQCGIIKTKYGYCYYNAVEKKYTNIESYLSWKKKKVDKLNNNDLDFIKSLPKKITIDDKQYFIHLGKYGLYLKDTVGNNLKLDKSLWSQYA